MAVRNFEAFKRAKSQHDQFVKNTYSAKCDKLLELIEEIRPFADTMQDIYDTFVAVENEDPVYAGKLWNFITGFDPNEGYVREYKMDADSCFGVHYCKSEYFTHITVRPGRIIVTYDPVTKEQFDNHGTDASEFISEAYDLNEEIIDKYIESVNGLLEWFPKFSDKFFELIENPKF